MSSAPPSSRKAESGAAASRSPDCEEAAGVGDNSSRADATVLSSVSWTRGALFFALAAAGCAIDLLTKHWVFQWRGPPRLNNQWWLWKDYIGVETTLNTGALFGMGAGWSGLFAALSLVAVVGILYWLFYRGAAEDRRLTIALGCVTGGILGNLYDRLGLYQMPSGPTNAVRDWILVCYGRHTWPNFNIADSLLVCGAMLLMWRAMIHQPPQEGSPEKKST